MFCAGLNPCFCGRWSTSPRWRAELYNEGIVLILVFVEDGLRDQHLSPSSLEGGTVLILVFVEDGLRVYTEKEDHDFYKVS